MPLPTGWAAFSDKVSTWFLRKQQELAPVVWELTEGTLSGCDEDLDPGSDH